MSAAILAYTVIGGAVSLMLRSVWVAFRRLPKSLPRGDGQPRDRAEAVRRILKHLERKSIPELEEGTAAVLEGTVRAIDGVSPVLSPVTLTQCIGFHLDIRAVSFDPMWKLEQLHDTSQCVDFEIVDDAGNVVRVHAEGLELAITDGPIGRFDPPLPASLLSLFPADRRHHAIASGTPITVEEGLLQPGARVLVCGLASSDLAIDNYRDGKPTLSLRASATFPLVASTDTDLFRAGDRPIRPEELRQRPAR